MASTASKPPTDSTPRHIVIVGGGIIGATTAFYLSRHRSLPAHSTITLLEASVKGIAQGASGKAGGLVARWAYPKELVRVSFDEHDNLANEFNGKDRWGYRFVGCGSWSGKGLASDTLQPQDEERKSLQKKHGLTSSPSRGASKLPADLDWVAPDRTTSYSSMAPDGDTAQVHPYLFTTSMLDLAIEHANKSPNDIRVSLMTGCRVTSINFSNDADAKTTGVSYESQGKTHLEIPATDVIITAGAWSSQIMRGVPIQGTRAHSITIVPPATTTATIAPYVLFSNIDASGFSDTHESEIDIEIYPRPPTHAQPKGEFYVCGAGDNEPLPSCVDDVQVDEKNVKALEEYARSMGNVDNGQGSSNDGKYLLRYGTVDKKQACYLPVVSAGGGPIVGEFFKGKSRGVYLASGHTCWGICNAPGTAKALAELVLDGSATCTNLAKFEVDKFMKVSQ